MLGAAIGFAIGIVLVEIIFANDASWPDVVPFGLGVAGWLVGGNLVGRRPKPRGETVPR